MALRATWQRHAGPRSADVTCLFIFIVIIRVIVHISIPYSVFSVQNTWQTTRRWIKESTDNRTWIAWTRGPPDPSNVRGINTRVITVVI